MARAADDGGFSPPCFSPAPETQWPHPSRTTEARGAGAGGARASLAPVARSRGMRWSPGGSGASRRQYLRSQRPGTGTASPVVPARVGASCWQRGQPRQVCSWWITAASTGDGGTGWAGAAPREEVWVRAGGTATPPAPRPLAAAGATHACGFLEVSPALGLRKRHRGQLHPSNRNSRNSRFPTKQTSFSFPSQHPCPQTAQGTTSIIITTTTPSPLKPQPQGGGG